VKAYVGQTRSKSLIDRLTELGLGECCCRGELPPRRTPWFYDNGAFRDWKKGDQFNITRFMRDMSKLATDLERKTVDPPDFIVVPDLVAAGKASQIESDSWLPMLERLRAPLYLAVQDGMVVDEICEVVDTQGYAGVFVGGTPEWKMETADQWCDLAGFLQVKAHIGRVGTPKKVLWAYGIYADSIDSSYPLWSEDHLTKFVDALKQCPDRRRNNESTT
jgi:hypothetical protein